MNNPDVVTKAELLLITIAQVDALGTHISIYLSVVSAYLLTAYLVGKKLTTLQVSVATFVYIIAYLFEALLLMVMSRTLGNSMKSYSERYSVINPSSIDIVFIVPYIGLILGLMVLGASLWFMWSVRHPRE